MKIQKQQNTNFNGIYVKSKDAEKLLTKADRAIKATNAKFLDTSIPEGHKKPLWSVYSNYISKRQENNPNNIIIDVADKSKQLLSIKTLDSQGFTISKQEINPMPKLGSYDEFFPSNDCYRTYLNRLDTNLYARSNLFEALDRAEFEVDDLYQKQLAQQTEKQISLKELPKNKKKNFSASAKAIQKKAEKLRSEIHQHTQRPFENLKQLLTPSTKEKTEKLEPKGQMRMPRKLKKEAQKQKTNS